MADLGTSEIGGRITALAKDQRALAERVDYIHVAVMRGDPRFAKPEHAKPDFDCAAFDAMWLSKGKRVPDMAEVFGDG